jgi:hypothetical protein
MSRNSDGYLWAMIIVVFSFAAIIAILGTHKKAEILVEEIVPFEVDELYIEDAEPLPEVTIEAEVFPEELPEILPPLYEEPLPPLQGEV